MIFCHLEQLKIRQSLLHVLLPVPGGHSFYTAEQTCPVCGGYCSGESVCNVQLLHAAACTFALHISKWVWSKVFIGHTFVCPCKQQPPWPSSSQAAICFSCTDCRVGEYLQACSAWYDPSLCVVGFGHGHSRAFTTKQELGQPAGYYQAPQ